MSIIKTKTYNLNTINKSEVLRYLGVKAIDETTDALVNECIEESVHCFVYRVCSTECEIKIDGDIIDFGFMKLKSIALEKNLRGCTSVVLFAATIGIGIDRLIARYSRISPSKAVVFQAIGAERIESLCDALNSEVNSCHDTAPRFSPGYGDFPLSAQRDIFAILDCGRKIGLTLNDSMLMSPSKSVTAIIGIKGSE